MILIKEDIKKIESTLLEANSKFETMKVSGESIFDLVSGKIQAAKNDVNNRDLIMTAMGYTMAFREFILNTNMEEVNEDDPNKYDMVNYKGMTRDFCNNFNMDEHFFMVAETCLQVEDYIDFLPENEAYGLTKEEIKKNFNIDFDVKLDLDERAEEEVYQDNLKNVEELIKAEKDDISYMARCSSNIILDNYLLNKINDSLTERKNELNSFGGNKNVDDLLNDFNALEEPAMDVASRANMFDDKDKSKKTVDSVGKLEKDAKDIAGKRIGIYMAMKAKKDSRSFFDKLFHPIRTYKEYSAVSKMEKDVFVSYGLDKNNIDAINEVCSSTGKLRYIGVINRFEGTVYTNPTPEQIEEKLSAIVNASSDMEFQNDIKAEFSNDNLIIDTTEKVKAPEEPEIKINPVDLKTGK